MDQDYTNEQLADVYYNVYGLSQAFARPDAVVNRNLIAGFRVDIPAYFDTFGNLNDLEISELTRRARGIITLILSKGKAEAEKQVQGTTIGSLDRLLEEVLEPGRAKRIEELYVSAA